MRILFLHFSDAHIEQDTNLNNINTNAIVNSLAQLDTFDECIIIFSGDITKSGLHNEYLQAGKFIGRVAKGIKDKYSVGESIATMFVPGNHDLEGIDKKSDNKQIEEYYKTKVVEDKCYEELKKLDNFYTFARRNYCDSRGNVINVRTINFDDFKIKFNLINTAPFSLLGSGNMDKGLHYIPEKELSKLKVNHEENYTVSVIHHSPEWFCGPCKESLYENMYSSSNLIFVGHEHYSQSECIKINNKYNIDISSGVALYNTKTEHGFNTLVLDTEKHSINGFKYIYNGIIYKPTKNLNNEKIIFNGKSKFTFTQSFREYIETDINERAGEHYLDYFIFPLLESKDINEDLKNYKVSNDEKFLELLKIKQRISIEGSSKSGKTTLGKYLCKLLSEDYTPLLIEGEYCGIKDSKKLIKYTLENQFGDDSDLDLFEQLEPEKKVLIIDDSDKIKKEMISSLLEENKFKFGYIIILRNVDWKFNIREKAIEQLSANRFFYLHISPFYYEKRLELIQKICSMKNEHKIIDLSEKVQRINEDIANQIRYFQLTPDFIHQFVDYYLNFSFLKTKKESSIFSKVFEANIVTRIASNTEEDNVDEIMIALDFVAYYVHFNSEYPLKNTSFKIAIDQYNTKHDNNLKEKFVFDISKKSNIIREVPGTFDIEFCDDNLLAYFVAAHLNRKLYASGWEEDLNYVLNNVCFGINGDILLFLSYITSNTQILYPILDSLMIHMKDWEELSLDNKNIEYLCKAKTQVSAKLPQAKDKKKMVEEKNDMERKIVQEKKQNSESLYSYDESEVNSFGNKILKSIRYLELVGKVLPNFRHILTAEEKKLILQVIYKYPNQLLHFMLKDINENYDKIITDVLSKTPATRKGQLITRDIIEKEIENQSIMYILSIYDFIATTTITNKTIEDVNKFDYRNNTNYYLQNIMMEENSNGEFHQFAKKVEHLYDNTELNITKQMIKLIVRKYFLCHNVSIVGEAQHVVDKFFGEGLLKELTIAQAKQRVEKK